MLFNTVDSCLNFKPFQRLSGNSYPFIYSLIVTKRLMSAAIKVMRASHFILGAILLLSLQYPSFQARIIFKRIDYTFPLNVKIKRQKLSYIKDKRTVIFCDPDPILIF